MDELSRILIEENCWSYDTAKSKCLQRLVELSYGIIAEGTDADAIFLLRAL